MILEIPRETTFECPEGPLRASLYDIREHLIPTKTGVDKQVRLLFEVKHKRPDNKLVLVGKNYPPSLARGSGLREVLENWQGSEFFAHAGNQVDLKTLVEREADIVTRHRHNAGYRQPFVDLVGVYPPGTLTSTNQS